MTKRLPALALCALSAAFLAACGGGGSDDPRPSDNSSLVTVSSATVTAHNGIYGSTAIGLSDVEKVYDVSNTTCVFSFNNLTKVGDSSIPMSGKVSYREGATTLSRLEISVGGVVYASGAVDSSTVDREGNGVRFTNKTLASTASDTTTIVVNGGIPMRPGRPSGC